VNEPTFRKRGNKNEIQVRFYVDRKLYEQFKGIVSGEGLILRDVLGDFLLWFVRRHSMGLPPLIR